jgi:phosphatidylserine/phosphatidylglycerophosphate/cardiolipin synthase-like enzyme
MRFKSRKRSAGQVFAVTGTNTVSFGIVASPRTRADLLGFAVQRVDSTGLTRWMDGFKVFASQVPDPTPDLRVSTWDQPVQSFVWDDFTARAGEEYEYRFHTVKGRAWALERSAEPTFAVRVRTEPLSAGAHDIFFNRGVASSQAYVRKFGTGPIDALAPGKREAALRWLTRDLDEALLAFIDACEPGETLLGCFYEFRYEPAARALKAAVARGVDVRLVLDAKINEFTDKDGFHPSFPREDNAAMLAGVRFPPTRVVQREARSSAIQHNKFMVRVSASGRASEVWTGSTNLSLGGVAGQTNVGHHVRDAGVAAQFASYWDLLATDPGGTDADDSRTVRAKNLELRKDIEALSPVPVDLAQVDRGTTVVLSPRKDIGVLTSYAGLLDSARSQGCVTLAFGISSEFKSLLNDNTSEDQIVFLLLEKKDKPNPKARDTFVRLDSGNNVYQAWGSYLEDPVYQWTRETNAARLGLNKHVSYVHSKFMLIDPLSADPIVVTGSANFSAASTKENDENMLVIRGDRRVADIYLTEFNRIFNHYYFRSVVQDARPRDAAASDSSRFLDETPDWQSKYAPGRLRAKRLALFASMKGFTGL